MKNLIILLYLPLLLLSGCVKNEPNNKVSQFRVMGMWENPPGYSGNPFSPGGEKQPKEYIFSRLAVFNPLQNNYHNYLIKSYKVNNNTLTVKLKDGITWHDGIPFTSKDVRANFIIGGALGTYLHIWNYLNSIEVPNTKTVVFNVKPNSPQLQLNYILTEWQQTPYHLYEELMPEAVKIVKLFSQGKTLKNDKELSKIHKEFREKLLSYKPDLPIGVGPFKLVKVTSDNMLLEKHNGFPDSEKITVNQVVLTKNTTNDIMWSEIKLGKIDIEKPTTPPDVVESILASQPKIKHVCAPDFATACLLFNNSKYPFSELNFRKAVAHIINKDKVREVAMYYGTTSKYTSGVLPSLLNKWVDTKNFNLYDRNWDKAAELLEQIGFTKNSKGIWCGKDNKKLSFEIGVKSDYTDWVIAAEEISRQLTRFGLKTTVRLIEKNIVGLFFKSDKFDMGIDYSVLAKRSPYEGFKRIYHKGGWIDEAAKQTKTVKGPAGKNIDLSKLTNQLAFESNKVKEKEIVQTLAWATNQYLPFIELFEKNSQFFICNGIRVTGWPKGEELYNGLAADWKIYTIIWMLEEKLKVVKKK